MARRVFFSFHYERDIWRASIVRNSWVTKADREAAGFWDASLWEETKRRGDAAIQRLIDGGLENTSVTVVLIGAETSSRRWVQYEITKSLERGNGLLGIYIHNIKDQAGRTDRKGDNPFAQFTARRDGRTIRLSDVCHTYDWVNDDGYSNLGKWVEKAAKDAGR